MLESKIETNWLLRLHLKASRYYKFATYSPYWSLVLLLGRLKTIRDLIGVFFASPSLEKYQEEYSLFEDIDVNKAVEALKKDGYYLGLHLPKIILQEMINFVNSNNIYARTNPNLKFRYFDREKVRAEYGDTFVHGCYPKTDVRRLSAIQRLEKDPKLLKIAASYLGAEPVHIRTELTWYFVAERKLYEKIGDAQVLFHYDLDDFRAIKFFFYLTDVDCFSGSHVCVRGSHKKKKLTHQFCLFVGRSDREICNYYGTENLVTIDGKAGFGFAEDTFCFHRGTPPANRDRLMLQIGFALKNTGITGIEH